MNKNIFANIIGFISHVWWTFWSNIRFLKSVKDCEVNEEDKPKTYQEIVSLVSRLYKNFKYTKDGLDQLGDAITPPPQNYKYYLEGEVRDDCDGFHSLVYHCLHAAGLECYLLSAVAINGGHCILLFKLNNKWYINDYRKVYAGRETALEAIKDYNKIFPEKYGTKKVLYNGLVKYDYKNHKFRKISIKKLK